MTRTRCYAMCFCLAIANIGPLAPLSAQQPRLDTRFLAEGPKGWETLKASLRQLEGMSVSRYKLGAHPVTIDETKFKVNGDFLLFEETRKGEDGKLRKVRAFAVNSKYRFVLQQHRPPSSWTLGDMGSPSDRLHLHHPYGYAWAFGFVRFLNAPFTVGGMPISEMISETGFKLGKVAEVTRAGKKLAKIEFTYTPPKVIADLVNGTPIRIEKHMTDMRGGWMLLDPEGNWALQECSLDLEGGEKGSCIVEYGKTQGGLVVPSRVFEKDNAVSAHEVTFSDLRFRDIPEEEFTMTAYGLREPEGVIWPKPTRWWLWISVAAGGAVVVGIGWWQIYRRYRPAEAIKQPTK